MVHGQLIKEGKVKPLTFKQLRRLEKMDLEKEREKLLVGAPAAAIYQFGEVIKAAVAGVFQLGAAAAQADPISHGINAAAALLIITWINLNFPNLSKFLHLDLWPSLPGGGPAPPPTGQPPVTQSLPGQPPATSVIAPTGKNPYSLDRNTLLTGQSQATSGNTIGCVATLVNAGGDITASTQLCSNWEVGAGQA